MNFSVMSLTAHNVPPGTLQGGTLIKASSSVYTPGQISTWLSTIGFPHSFTEDDILHGRFPTTLENLHIVTRLHIIAFPFENIMMHYSADHYMDISTEGLYKRMVIGRGGSYCFGLNGLFSQMILGLGYRAYTGAARINIAEKASDTPVYTAFSHMIIFVQPGADSNETYLVDVGCGGSGLTRPILLSDAEDNVVIGTTPTEMHRLRRGAHPASRLASSERLWHLDILQIKDDVRQAKWRVVYAFSEEEYFPTDYESANFAVCRRPQPGGLFWKNIVCSKHFWLDSHEVGASDGGVDKSIMTRYMGRLGMEGRTVRRHVGSQSEVIRTMATETERTAALRELFGIDLSPEDLEHVRGRDAALSG
ncbi:putative N-acetyltransferase [Lyophyllum shimeji]|uniref:N-acetyltransferase n=1 Tax=Lyophyllum shimeji TaxID=47721 RepID=A0A9P3PDP3_LYOSH|nr:putative N-acetyltransferase [Lyophyllum shimeji]